MGHFSPPVIPVCPATSSPAGLEDLDRRAHAADAVQKFSANEADAAQQFQGVGAQAEA